MKRVCIHQPDFAPWLGFFHRLLTSDVFILLDDAQYVSKGRGWHNRDKIKTPHGERWLTVSVENGPLSRRINEVRLSAQTDWREKNLSLIKENYRRADHFEEFFPVIERLYASDVFRLVDFNVMFIRYFLEVFCIGITTIFASDLKVHECRNERLIQLIKRVEGTNYLSGLGAKAYLDEEMFRQAGIVVEWQDFRHPVYPQLHGEFMPNLSCLDILFNCGPMAREILWSTVQTVSA